MVVTIRLVTISGNYKIGCASPDGEGIQMKIVITGGNGYIGKALKRRIENSADIEGKFVTIDEEYGFIHTDFSVENLTRHFESADVVIHLAAVRGGKSIDDFRINSQITENVMLAAAAAGVPRFVFMSSIAVYSDTNILPWNENQPCSPVSLYGISKLTCESICKLYAKQNGIDGTILRLAPVYGPNDPNKRLIANFVRRTIAGEDLEVNGKSVSKRDFIYLDDVVSALLFAIKRQNNGVEIVNIGSGCLVTNYEIASHIVNAFGNNNSVVYHSSMPENMPPAYMDLSYAHSLGYKASYDMEAAMAKIAEESVE